MTSKDKCRMEGHYVVDGRKSPGKTRCMERRRKIVTSLVPIQIGMNPPGTMTRGYRFIVVSSGFDNHPFSHQLSKYLYHAFVFREVSRSRKAPFKSSPLEPLHEAMNGVFFTKQNISTVNASP
jgi:hypothetical protein